MNTLNQEINTAFQATSLLLVFVTVLFGLRYPKILDNIKEEIPAGPDAKKKHKERLRRSLLSDCGPILIISGVISYLFLPLFVKVCSESHFELWDFDFARTSFFIIALLVFIVFLWSVSLIVRLVIRIYRVDHPRKTHDHDSVNP